MRTLLLILLLLNLALFGWVRGLFGSPPVSGREASRMEQQIAAERIRVLTDWEVQQLEKRAVEAKAAAAPVPPPEPAGACMEIGEFANDAQLARLREKLGELKLADRASEQTREAPGWYRVFLPPAKTLADAEQRAAQLRGQGVRDLIVLQDDKDQRFAILLGSFRDRELARRQAAQLDKRGLKDVRVADNPTTVRSARVQVRGVDAAALQQLEKLQKDFPQQKLQPCTSEGAP